MKIALYSFLFGILFIIIIGYIDFQIISPILLPEDQCFYHTNKVPFWVELLYMSKASNGHPDGSITHLILIIIVGGLLGHSTAKKVVQNK